MRNPSRTTKTERRLARRYNPTAARVLGVAEAARWYRNGSLLDEAEGFASIVNDLKYGIIPDDLNDRVDAAIYAQRDALERTLGALPGALNPTSSNVNHYSGGPTGYTPGFVIIDEPNPAEVRYPTVESVTVEPDGWLNLKYAPHISAGLDVHQVDQGVLQELIDDTPEAQPSDTMFGVWESYRAGRTLGEAYLDWDGDPWRDPNEVDAMHAEAIENALNDDHDPGE
jgi:hypothetical protein